jgi:hypothetical protein
MGSSGNRVDIDDFAQLELLCDMFGIAGAPDFHRQMDRLIARSLRRSRERDAVVFGYRDFGGEA